jgi:hypothetical protein
MIEGTNRRRGEEVDGVAARLTLPKLPIPSTRAPSPTASARSQAQAWEASELRRMVVASGERVGRTAVLASPHPFGKVRGPVEGAEAIPYGHRCDVELYVS